MNRVLEDDINEIVNSEIIKWQNLNNKAVLITGATGLIGSLIVKSILKRNEKFDSNINMILVVRDIDEAVLQFGNSKFIGYVSSSIENYSSINKKIDFIIHGASPTKSKFFINFPVETIDASIIGTKNILEQAKKSKIESMVYLSSMEMYGTIDEENVTEDMIGNINILNTRSSYSEGKRASELYCYSYYDEYNVPVKIARIAQTFGAGIGKKENRVYKYFVDAILNETDIIVKSTGKTIINFSYTVDTVIGLLKILLDGKNGEAYNIVSNKTNMTVLESAKWLANKYGKGKVNVKVEIPKDNEGFAPDNTMILDNKKLKSLGWMPKYSLQQGYDKLIEFLREEENEENINRIPNKRA